MKTENANFSSTAVSYCRYKISSFKTGSYIKLTKVLIQHPN